MSCSFGKVDYIISGASLHVCNQWFVHTVQVLTCSAVLFVMNMLSLVEKATAAMMCLSVAPCCAMNCKVASAMRDYATLFAQVSALSPASSKPGCSTNTPGMLAALRTIVRQEGVTALWRGNFATIVHRIPYSAVNFTTFEMSKKYLEPHVSNDVLRRLVSGAAAGLVACTAVRMCHG